MNTCCKLTRCILEWRKLLALLLAVSLSGCGSSVPVPVINKSPNRLIPPSQVVKPGDSIYNISWQYGLDYKAVAKWNSLSPPYRLRQGQQISLRPGAITKPVTSAPTIVSAPLPSEPLAPQTPAAAPKAATSAQPSLSAPSKWIWPATGNLAAKFSRNKVNGIEITGAAGSAILTTAAGEVVYVGEGLRGYGKLIIVKHSEKYLSAYAHNRAILVKEGARVKAGQQIAEMGASGTNRTMLHFEIRVNGKPEDPLKYLQSRG